jgi:predicted metal-dependent hydrolase
MDSTTSPRPLAGSEPGGGRQPGPAGAADGRTGPPSAVSPTEAVDVRRSNRRRRTVSAYRDGDRTVVLLPARMTRAEERHWVAVMLDRLAARERRQRPSDSELAERAQGLSERFLAGRARPASVRWVSNQNGRWGSCTVDDRSIRLSDRLQAMPAYVIDYVLLHELVHLLVPGHGPKFWAELDAYPHTQRARGYLDGWSGALGVGTDGLAGLGDPAATGPPEAMDEVGDDPVDGTAEGTTEPTSGTGAGAWSGTEGP